MTNVTLAHTDAITTINTVVKLCKEKSEVILQEQGIMIKRWSAQTFNGDRTFNVEGTWETNAGLYVAECELPYGASEAVITVILSKI